MRISFFSNFFNDHQLPLALEFCAIGEVEYTFVSLLAAGGMVGRSSLDDDYSFVIKEYDGGGESLLAMRHAIEDDIVVFGDMAGKEEYVRARAKTGRPFFRYAERLLKRGDWWRFVPPKMYRTWNRFGRYAQADMGVLCASAYTARDLSLFGLPVQRCLKWGYFPLIQSELSYRQCERTLPRHKKLCSAQRLIPCKRVELQLHALQRVCKDGIDIKLTIAGDGPERPSLEALAVKLGISNYVTFLGELSHSDTLYLMQNSSVFIATSDRNEGWGATINEAMGQGCCVIASEEMGSVPYLINDKSNGLVFHGGDADELAQCMRRVLMDEDYARRLGREAQQTVYGAWSAREAANRLFALSQMIIDEGFDCALSEAVYSDGPLSPASVKMRGKAS